jgi:hypothetical protein
MTTYQERFHREWGSLRDPHVRSLAWLLTAPQLLAPSNTLQFEQIATLVLPEADQLHAWLHDLDRQPTTFHSALALHKYRRLGHYAENLLRYFFEYNGELVEHGLQIQQNQSTTVGEFDFLLKKGSELWHLEMATKFYLFYQTNQTKGHANLFDFLGPNLADTLGAKMEKIVGQQLLLSAHPAAQLILAQAVHKAQVLMKGWLFYRESMNEQVSIAGIAPGHCAGTWWTVDELQNLTLETALILPKLQWLAPALAELQAVLDKEVLIELISTRLKNDQTPIMIALMKNNGDCLREVRRGMVVPNDWMMRAEAREIS